MEARSAQPLETLHPFTATPFLLSGRPTLETEGVRETKKGRAKRKQRGKPLKRGTCFLEMLVGLPFGCQLAAR